MTKNIGRILCRTAWLFVAFSVFASGAGLTQEIQRGSVTNLPVPRYVSLKSDDANVRRGPSLAHRIDWVFKHRGMPLQIVDEYDNWRRVKDRDGAGGWMHYSLLSGSRTVILNGEMTPLYLLADKESQETAKAEDGAIAKLEKCLKDWCYVSADKAKGWVQKTAIWGVGADEIKN